MNATATYSVVVFPSQGDAYRAYGSYHAANRVNGRYRTLCGKTLYADDFHCAADEPHSITCKKCRKELGN